MLGIKKERQRASLSQKALAEKAGITQAFLSEIETGAKKPSLTTAQNLAHALGCTVDELLSSGDKDA